MNTRAIVMVGILSIAFLGCGKPQVVPMDGDTYLVQKRSAQVGFGPPEGAKAEVYEIANAFCANQGKVVETVAFHMVDSGFARPGSVSLQFRCVPPPLAAKPSPTATPAEARTDAAKRLEDLKKLRDQGLITQEDYDKKKKEILDKF